MQNRTGRSCTTTSSIGPKDEPGPGKKERGPIITVSRLLAAMLFAVAFLCFALAAALFPPILEAFVLVDHNLGSGFAKLAASLASLLALGCAIGLSRAARQLFSANGRHAVRRIQFVATALVFSSLVVAVLLEVGTRVAFAPEDYLTGDAFWIHRWREARQTESSADAALFQSDFPMNRYDAELGWAPLEGFRSEAVNITSRGARAARDYASPKPADTKRIVVIGDSFSFGEGVRDNETYPSQLEALLVETEVVNLGVLGHGTDQQLLRLRNSAFDYEPDLILLGFFGPNAERNLLSFRDAPKPRFLLAGNGIELTNTPVPGPDRAWPSPLPILRGPALLAAQWQRVIDRTRFAPKWNITLRILDEIANECAARGVPLLLAFYPDKGLSFVRQAGDTEIVVESWARARNIEFLSIRPALEQLEQVDRVRVFYGHWTPYGNGLVAEALAERLAMLGFAQR